MILAVIFVAGFARTNFASCVFPDTQNQSQPQAAPAWVCLYSNPDAIKVDGYPFTAIGQTNQSALGSFHDIDMAAMKARNNLATRMRVEILREVKYFLATYGVDQKIADMYFTDTSIQYSEVNFSDCPTLGHATSRNGTVYVLVGVKNVDGQKMVADAISSSLGNHSAALQRKIGEESTKALQKKADDNRKYTGSIELGQYKKESGAKYFQDPETKELVKIVEVTPEQSAKAKAVKSTDKPKE